MRKVFIFAAFIPAIVFGAGNALQGGTGPSSPGTASASVTGSVVARNDATKPSGTGLAGDGEDLFREAMEDLLPLSPRNLGELTDSLERLEKVSPGRDAPGAPMPECMTVLENVSPDPGSPLPHLYLETGYVSTISIVDATGEPWPIREIMTGNPDLFEVRGPLGEGHILSVSPVARYGRGNLSVTLEGLGTPLILILSCGGGKVHGRLDIRLPLRGPRAKAPLVSRDDSFYASDTTIMGFLQGVPPEGARILDTDGRDWVQAWSHGDRLYVRSRETLLSPAPEGRISSSDGMTACRLSPVPVLVFSRDGVPVRVRVLEDMLK